MLARMDPISRLARRFMRQRQGFEARPVSRNKIEPRPGVAAVENGVACADEHAQDYARKRA